MRIKDNEGNKYKVFDIVNMIVGVFILVLAAFAFWNREFNMVFFPFIFLLGSYMNFIIGMKMCKQGKKKFGIGIIIFSVVLFIISIASAVT